MNHSHIEDKAVAISRLRSGKDLSDTYKDHPFHQGTIEEEIPVIVAQQDIDSEDMEEQTKAKPDPDTYKPHVPYPQALNRSKAKVNESGDHILKAFHKMTITIPLIDVNKHIPAYTKILRGTCTPHRNPQKDLT